MEKDDNTPFTREPWQQLLQDRADAPPETTNARIRASARRALAPRAARWCLPASLAASFLLAVLLVQWQYGDGEAPAVVTESDLASPEAIEPPSGIDSSRAGSGRAVESAPARQKEAARYRTEDESALDEFAAEPDAQESLDRITVTGSRIGGPEQELKAASEMPAEEASDDAAPPAPAVAGSPDAARERESQAEAGRESSLGASFAQTAVEVRTPEAWYADIEKLRAEGRVEEADRELERLKAAHPKWLERHLEELKRR
ncbi:MAG: hypothetical protein WD944_04525 [Steroidobacteraceae bacterium]